MEYQPTLGGRRRILVIEDGATMRMFYRDVLEDAGFEVAEAANGLEGVEKALVESFDLLLVDINLPKMDGYEVIRSIRADQSSWRLPIMTVSSEDKEYDSRRAYQAGANFYLTKPVGPDDLQEAVRLLTGVPAK